MCRSFSRGLASHGISSEIIFPIDMDIKHCTGCGDCSDGSCVMTDDMRIILDLFQETDFLVLASPIHFSGPSSVIKTVIDRFQPAWFKDMPHPKYATSLLSGGGAEPCFRNTISIFKAFSITVGMEWLDGLNISDTDNMTYRDVERPSFEHGDRIGSAVTSQYRI